MSFFTLEQLVSQGSWARLVDVFVDPLHLKELAFKHIALEEEGRHLYKGKLLFIINIQIQ